MFAPTKIMYTEYKEILLICGVIIVCMIIDMYVFTPIVEKKEFENIVEKLRHHSKTFKRSLPMFAGKGIVLPYYHQAHIINILFVVESLKKHRCSLPICVVYNGEYIDESGIALLHQYKIQSIDIQNKVSMDASELDGRQLRVFALVYSPFNEVMLIDPEIVLLMNPEVFFTNELYQSTGALFWRRKKKKSFNDRKTFRWLNAVLPYKKMDNPMLLKQSPTAQDSTIVLFNKESHGKTLHKLYILNKYWDTTYSYIDMEHDTFWISAELAKEPYAFYPLESGVIGENGKWYSLYMYQESMAFIPSVLDMHCEYTEYKRDTKNKIPENTNQAILELINQYKKLIHDIQTDIQNHYTDFYDNEYKFDEEL